MKKTLFYCLICILLTSLLIGCEQSSSDIKYTITKDEWDALVGVTNYTVQSKDNEGIEYNNYLHKYTEEAIDIDGTLIIFLDDKQYFLSEKETSWVALDCTTLNFEKGYLLENCNFEDYTYDESKKAYVSRINDQNYWNELVFENGILIKSTTFMLKEDLNEDNCYIIERTFSNIGTTKVDIPEYSFGYDDEIITTVTEQIWNKYMNEYNFSISYFTYESSGMEEIIQLSIKDAYYLNDNYYVLKEDKLYLLTKTDNRWIGKETDSFPGYLGSLLQGFSFNEVEYDQNDEAYVSKNIDENGYRYHFYFMDGVPTMIFMESSTSRELDKYFAVNEIGEIKFEIPQYVIE